MKKVLIIGGGIAGCAASHQFNLNGEWEIDIVEKGNELGAGNRTKYWGGHPYTFGPRHFLTPYEHIFEYFNKYVPLRKCKEHEAWTYVEQDNDFYNFPIHVDDIERMPDKEKIKKELVKAKGVEDVKNLEEYWINSVGETLYNKLVNKYNKKMWQIDDNKMHDTFSWSAKGVALKKGPKAFWSEWISAYPYALNGYDDYFDISSEGSNILLNTSIELYDLENKRIFFDGEWHKYDIIINTISPDIIFNYIYGKLPYVGIDLQLLVLPMEYCFPENVYFLYYANDEPFKRLVEYKKFTNYKSNNTLIGIEMPTINRPHYPIPIKVEKAKHQRYIDLFPDNVFSIGRAGTYDYSVDIDDCLKQAIEVMDKI